MATATSRRTSRDRTRAYRERLRARGLKPVTLMLPDVNDPEFIAQAQRDCRLISQSPEEKEIMEWLDDVRAWPEDDSDVPDLVEPGSSEK